MFQRIIQRAALAALVGLIVLVATGCGRDAASDQGRRSYLPPATAGRACQLLDYDVVADRLGTRFDTAGGATKDVTYTCALTQAGRDYPDLTLALTATKADEVIFTATVTPSGSTAVKGLGRIAYAQTDAGADARGPATEVGWLSSRGRILVVRYTFPPATPAQQVNELTPKLIALAKQIENITLP